MVPSHHQATDWGSIEQTLAIHVVPDIGSGLMTAIVCSSASTLPRWRLAAQFYGAVFHVTPTASRLTPNLYVRFPAEKLKIFPG